MALKFTRQLIAEIRRPSHVAILKWDRNQPRAPKGSGAESGRWVADASQGLQGEEAGKTKEQSLESALASVAGNAFHPQASYAAIMNAPSGTGFANVPRISGDPEMVKRLTTPVATESDAYTALKTANLDDVEPNSSGATNKSFHVTMDDANHTEAIMKPEIGETWEAGFVNKDIDKYVTNRDFSLAEREEFAYDVGVALKIPFVPATVMRESLDLASHGVEPGDEGGGSGYDSSELRDMYDKYREKAQEDAMDAVGDQMGQMFREAQDEHVQDIKNRADEVADIWNELIDKEHPIDTDFAAQKEHPVLPMGSQPPFERRDPPVIDPLEVLDEAGVDVAHTMSPKEEEGVQAILRKHLQEGVQELGDVDEDAAKEHLDYDNWMESHQDTENRMYESKIKTFDSWRQSKGYGSGGGGNFQNNDQAPHPDGASLQHFIHGTYGSPSKMDGAKMAILDYVIGTMDRHGGNLMLATDPKDGLVHPVAIDNGYSMPASPTPDGFKFRSSPVEHWRNGSDKLVLKPLRDTTLEALEKTDWQALIARHPGMNKLERDALFGRIENMKGAMKYDAGLKDLWSGQDLMGQW